MNDTEILRARLSELMRRSEDGYFTFTDFLGLSEQAELAELCRTNPTRLTKFGGAEGAERVIVRFGDPGELGYEADFPISTLMIKPKSEKFADRLSHRDFLGALLNLGIERAVLGDIIIRENTGYVFVLDDMKDYISSSLTRIKHTDVLVTAVDEVPHGELYKTEPRRITADTERLDSLVAKVFNLSRSDAQSLIKRRLVFVDGRLVESVSYTPKVGEKVSVRGHGRLIYRGVSGSTARGRLAIIADVYV